jgi:hypothetical protein
MSAMPEATHPIEKSAVADASRTTRKCVVIVGGGFAVLAADLK